VKTKKKKIYYSSGKNVHEAYGASQIKEKIFVKGVGKATQFRLGETNHQKGGGPQSPNVSRGDLMQMGRTGGGGRTEGGQETGPTMIRSDRGGGVKREKNWATKKIAPQEK